MALTEPPAREGHTRTTARQHTHHSACTHASASRRTRARCQSGAQARGHVVVFKTNCIVDLLHLFEKLPASCDLFLQLVFRTLFSWCLTHPMCVDDGIDAICFFAEMTCVMFWTTREVFSARSVRGPFTQPGEEMKLFPSAVSCVHCRGRGME